MSVERIRELNDTLRTTLDPKLGHVVMGRQVAALHPEDLAIVIERVRTYSEFTEDNDPSSHHSYGAFEHRTIWYCFKIEYTDQNGRLGASDPADPTTTIRTLTIVALPSY